METTHPFIPLPTELIGPEGGLSYNLSRFSMVGPLFPLPKNEGHAGRQRHAQSSIT